MEKTVNDNRAKVAVGELSKIEALIAGVRKASEGEDVAAIRKATEELQQASHALAEELYKTQGSQGARGAQGSPESNVKDAEVVDAEYAETK